MKALNSLCVSVLVCCLAALIAAPAAGGVKRYMLDVHEMKKLKKLYDDTTPLLSNEVYGPKKIMPAEDYAKLVFDIEEMKARWAEVVGFKAPDVVGKIAPEIKPGKYTYRDKERYPFKDLMIPLFYEKLFMPGEDSPQSFCVSEFEVVPTEQIYYSLPLAEATLKRIGEAKQDAEGFIIFESYDGTGPPFPRPSGSERHKAMQIIYNHLYHHDGVDDAAAPTHNVGWNKEHRMIFESRGKGYIFRSGGRIGDPERPYWDERAEELGELQIVSLYYDEPRDQFGNVIVSILKKGIEPAQLFVYSGMLRRIRKMTGSDAQDVMPGNISIFDDLWGFHRVLSPTLFPYDYKMLAEREYLVPFYTKGMSETFDSKTIELKNAKFQRRPLYVVELTQRDPTYVYGRTVLYIDAENFLLMWVENYDQKGRLWRGSTVTWFFITEMGFNQANRICSFDWQSGESYVAETPAIPNLWMTRDYLSLGNIQHLGK